MVLSVVARLGFFVVVWVGFPAKSFGRVNSHD